MLQRAHVFEIGELHFELQKKIRTRTNQCKKVNDCNTEQSRHMAEHAKNLSAFYGVDIESAIVNWSIKSFKI